MSNISLLDDIYNKKGEEFIKKLFNLNVTISEKISGATFGFEYNSGNFNFYKKTSGNPLTKIDRILMKFYEIPINYIKNLPKDILKDLPVSFRFMFEYFIDNKPNLIAYDNLPKNSLILTHIVDNSNNKKNIIADKESLDFWAKKLNVNPPPIIFQGKLSDEAKDKLFQFLKMTKEQALETFKTTSFTKFLITAVNPKLKKTILNNDLNKIIDGIIFTFENGLEKINAKLIDPVFNELINKNKEKTKTDIIPLIFGDMIEFMEINRSFWEKYEFKKIDFYDRYIEIISKLFIAFYKKYEERYKDFTLTVPDFMKKPGFEINTQLIDNINLLKLFEKSPKSKNLFKIFLALFRKKKRNAEEFMSPVIIKYQNEIVDSLLNIISKNNFKNESSIPIFSEFCEIYSNDIELYEDQKIDDLSINESIKTPNSIISFWQSIFSKNKSIEKNEKLKPINLLIGKFQPINNKHIDCAKELKKINNYKTFIVQINNDKPKKNQPFNIKLSEELFKKIIDSDDKKIFEGYIISPNNNLKEIIHKLSKNYKIEKICVSEKYKEFIKKQIEYRVFEGTMYYIDTYHWTQKQIDDIDISSSKIIEAIKENDYKTFRKLCPEKIWVNFEQLREEIKKF